MFSTTILAAGDSGFSLVWPALPDLLWGTLAFVIVAVAVYKFAWPTFSKTLDERTEKIENGLQAAELARAEIAQERENLASTVVDAHREASEIREKAQENAKSIIVDAQAKARSDADSILAGAQQRIAADTDAASRNLRSDVGILATELAGRIVGEAMTDQEMAQRVIDRFLDDLDATTPASAQVGNREA
ncbi:MAG: F0F1 ATP synthase subunit B [Actinomycetaceae bacterium]|nr:F0F1 ATP synthase subunit B [Arcanobacterium sp.]MDD7504973.1 F0F1 ATP synthase subunit B [Actinomycetaceae bacterium]MDY6143370.1 F0F1 ATP synthase subunit B [Arcanobacterium sp.]